MRRLMALLLACALLLPAGCGSREAVAPAQDGFRLYYPYALEEAGDYAGELGALGYETAPEIGTEPDVAALLERYLEGPQSPELTSPFPAGLAVESFHIEDGCMTLVLSREIQSLFGMDRTMAAACLVYTLTQLPEVERVFLDAGDGGISDGLLATELTREDFLLFDDSFTSDQVSLRVYFADAEDRYLVAESRKGSFSSDQEMVSYLVRQLMDGPTEEGAERALPEGMVLLGVELSGGVCTVNFSEAFLTNRPKTHAGARMAVFSLVNTLTELTQVEAVQILCVGRTVGNYGGLNLSQPLHREEDALGAMGLPSSGYDATLYVPCSGGLGAVPLYIRRTTGRSLEADLLSALIAFPATNGYENPFPEGTVAAEVTVEDGLCRVSFNSAFAQCDADPAQATLAVRSVVATLCGLSHIDRVQLDQSQAPMTSVDLSEPIAPEDSWFLP